jgi:hypothetical protein
MKSNLSINMISNFEFYKYTKFNLYINGTIFNGTQ